MKNFAVVLTWPTQYILLCQGSSTYFADEVYIPFQGVYLLM